MLNKISEFLSRDTSELSTTGLIFICVGVLLFVLLNIFFIRVCRGIITQSGRKSFTIVKIIMVALFPTIFNIAAVFNRVLPMNIIFILTAVMCVIVAVWDFLVYGPIGGLLFSYLHILGGIISGLLIASLVFMAFFIILITIIRPLELPSTGSSGTPPEYVRDLSSGETFYVTSSASGDLQIDRGGYIVLYPSGYAGEYVDNYNHRYIACED